MTDQSISADLPEDEPHATFVPLVGDIAGLDFEPDDVTIVHVAIPKDKCPRLGKQRVHLWVFTELSDEDWEALNAF